MTVAIALTSATAAAQDVEALPDDAPEVQRLAALAAQLGDADAGRREAARDAFEALTPDDLPAIRGRIARIRRGRPPQNWAIDVMNRFRRLGRTEDALQPDLVVGAMEELSREHHIPQERERVVAMAEPALLWAALERMDSLEAQRAAFGLIGLDEGLWMPEARNWVRRRGVALTSAAIYARGDGDRHVREWGRHAYDATGADNPGRVIPAMDVDRLPDLLRAYANARIQSAMRVIVSYTGHSRRAVRRAAREAMETYGTNAIWILRTAYRNETGEHPPREWGADRVSRELYAQMDARRMEPVRIALEAGQAARAAGDLDAMRASFDDVLARMPELEEPGPVASGYAELAARAAAAGQAEQADADYRRALRLAPRHADAPTWRAQVELLAAQRAAERGVWDEAAYRRVLEVLPEQEAAVAALAAMELPAEARAAAPSSTRTRWGIAAAILLGLLGLGLLWRPARPARVSIDPFEATLDDTIDEADVTLPDAA
ncbi:MAG: hypothetical protein H6719_14320 [Sandaracinaceae bacterium]|nr:hypothetical protein [Sandaracinaceae bacterium]